MADHKPSETFKRVLKDWDRLYPGLDSSEYARLININEQLEAFRGKYPDNENFSLADKLTVGRLLADDYSIHIRYALLSHSNNIKNPEFF